MDNGIIYSYTKQTKGKLKFSAWCVYQGKTPLPFQDGFIYYGQTGRVLLCGNIITDADGERKVSVENFSFPADAKVAFFPDGQKDETWLEHVSVPAEMIYIQNSKTKMLH